MSKKMTVLVEKSNGTFTARCAEVEVVSQGKTLGQAIDRISEAITLYMEKGKVKTKDVYVATVEVEA